MLVKKETLKESGWMMKKNNSGEPEILAGIVTCNPEITLLSKNIRALEDQVSEIIIIDNDSENRDQIIALANSFDSIHVLLNQTNKGLASALNQVFQYAVDNEYGWYLSMDQDSVVSHNLIENYRPYMKENIGILCPFLLNNNKISLEEYKSLELPDIEKIREPIDCITSASLNQTNAIETVGGYNERLFIDCIDVDLNIRLMQKGLSIYRVNDSYLLQQMGEGKQVEIFRFLYQITGKSIFQKLSVSPVYSDLRLYYIARNSAYINQKYPNLAGKRMSNLWMTAQFVYYFLTFPKNRSRKKMWNSWKKGRSDAAALMERSQ
ncbi:glycosyltransferase [Ileibacterium valens]|nr:glycosyltransferase [Ileibacterium valens]